jgi:hypothetical protein
VSKENFKVKENFVAGPRWVPDTKTDWPTRLTVGRNVTLTLTLTSLLSAALQTSSGIVARTSSAVGEFTVPRLEIIISHIIIIIIIIIN